MRGNDELNQYFTPVFAAEMIVAHYYPNLTSDDLVFDIGCGDGRFLKALPEHVPAVGFEIDPAMAAKARVHTGREVVVGDFTQLPFPGKPTLFLGNPPFEMDTVNSLLSRAYEVLDYGKECGFLLPVYFFQTADTVMEYNKKWGLRHDLLPRNLFAGMIKPLMFARFVKERTTTMVGMFLYEETSAVLKLAKRFRTLFIGNESRSNLWAEVVEMALVELGGTGTLEQLYAVIEGKRPTENPAWKAQVRKQVMAHYKRIAPATYAMDRIEPEAALKPVPASGFDSQLALVW